MSHTKKFTISIERVNQSIIWEEKLSVYRLLPTQRQPVEDKVDYTETIQHYLNEVSEQKMVDYSNRDGWHIGKKTSRLFLNCKPESHQNGKHVLFYNTNSLKPDNQLTMNWIIKCEKCKLNIPADDDALDTDSSQQVHQVTKSSSSTIKKVQQKSPKTPNPELMVNIEDSVSVIPNHQAKAVLNVYSRIADKMAALVQESYDKCENSADPIEEALRGKTELSVRLALAVSELIDELAQKPRQIDQNNENDGDVQFTSNNNAPSSGSNNASSSKGLSSKASALLKKATAAREAHEAECINKQLEKEVEEPVEDVEAAEMIGEITEPLKENVADKEAKRGHELSSEEENLPKRPKIATKSNTIENFLKKSN